MATTIIGTAITLDLSCTSPRVKVYAKQGDGGTRQIVAQFKTSLSQSSCVTLRDSDGNTVYDHIEFNVLRPDGYVVKSTATVPSGENVPVCYGTLTAEMLQKAGRAFGDFILVSAAGNTLSAARFVLEITEAADSERSIPPPTPQYLLMVFDAATVADYLLGSVYDAATVADYLLGSVYDAAAIADYLLGSVYTATEITEV